MQLQVIFRSVWWAAVGAWSGRLAGIVIFVVLTRMLAPEAIGAVSLVMTYVMLAQLLADPGFSEYIVQHAERDPTVEQSVFWMQLGASTALMAAVWIASPWLALTLPASMPGEALIVSMSLILPLGACGLVAEALLRRQLAFKQMAMRTLVAATLGGVAGVACAYAGLGLWSLVVKQLVETGVNTVGQFVLARWRPRAVFSAAALKAPLRYGSAILGTRLVSLAHARLDTLVVGWLLGPVMLGHYTVAQRTFQIVSDLFNGVINAVGLPLLAHAKAQPKALAGAFLRLVRGGSGVSMPAYAMLAVCAPRVVEAVFGAKWQTADQPLVWLCLTGVVSGPLWFNSAALQATNRAATWMMVVATYVLVGSLLLPLGAVVAGLNGVAAVMLLRALLLAPLSAHVALRTVGVTVRDYVRAWLPGLQTAAVTAACMVAADHLLQRTQLHDRLALAVVALVGIGAMALVTLKLSPLLWTQLRARAAGRLPFLRR